MYQISMYQLVNLILFHSYELFCSASKLTTDFQFLHY